MIAHIRFTDDASDAASELRDLQRISARFALEATDRTVDDLGNDLKELEKHGVPEFSYSKWEFRFLALSNGCWAGAIGIPIYNLAKRLDWAAVLAW